MKSDTILKIENLRAYYLSPRGLVRAVDDVSFEVREGECVGILGESGCGKTSMALAITGLFERIAQYHAGISNEPGLRKKFDRELREEDMERPGVQGKVIFRGRELTAMPQEELVKIRGKELAFIPQGLTHALNPIYSIGYQTGEPVEIHDEKVRLIELKRRVLEYLGLVNIADAGTRYILDPGSFSGGEAQRILIAMALIAGPYLVIADEPTSALDVTIQRKILDVMAMIRDQFDVSLIVISHDAGVVAEISDRVAVMYAGKIMEIGDAKQMFLSPSHPYTIGLMGSFPTIAMMRMRAGGPRPQLRGVPGDPPDLTSPPPGCPFHPRCQYAIDECRTRVPEYRQVEQDHWIRCHRYGEIQAD